MLKRPLRILDPIGVTNCLNVFMHCLDTGDVSKFEKLFTPDARVSIPKVGAELQGPTSIGTVCKNVHAAFGPLTMHLEFNPVITLHENQDDEHILQRVRNRSYWQAVQGGEIVSSGVHEDVLVLRTNLDEDEQTWRFESRIILHHFTASDGFSHDGKGCLLN
jgi:hypothetical protein